MSEGKGLKMQGRRGQTVAAEPSGAAEGGDAAAGTPNREGPGEARGGGGMR